MDKKCFVILNHQITEMQKKELKERFSIKEIKTLPSNLKDSIVEINPEKWIDKEVLKSIKQEITSFLEKGDYLWVQTEYGLTCHLVQYAFEKGFIPIYSATKRVFKETKLSPEQVKREYLFQHICFRLYKEVK